MTKPTLAIIGAGAVGLATAADLVRRGYNNVRLCDKDPQVVAALVEQGGVHYSGLIGSGFSAVQVATSLHGEAVTGADVILVSTSAADHSDVAASLAPAVSDGQVVILHQGCVGVAYLFERELLRHGCQASTLLAETTNTAYFSGRPGPTSVFVQGVKAWLELTCFPAGSEQEVIDRLGGAFTQFTPGTNSLETGLNNPNPMVHVPAYLLNLSLVGEKPDVSGGTLYLDDVINEPVDRFVELLDEERLAVMEAFGLNKVSRDEFGTRAYPPGSILESDLPRFGPTLLPRFIEEDVPAGLVPIVSLAALVGIDTPVTKLLIDLASLVWGVDFMETGRTIDNFGMGNLDPTGVVAAFAGNGTAGARL